MKCAWFGDIDQRPFPPLSGVSHVRRPVRAVPSRSPRSVPAVLALTPAAASAACPEGAQCATLTVPLDHSGATPGTLSLAYAKLAGDRHADRDDRVPERRPGPGGDPADALVRGAARAAALELRHRHGRPARDRRLGRGRLPRRAASTTSRRARPSSATSARSGTRRRPRRTSRTCARALGVDKLTLLGVSYGAKVASEYARRYPASTAALVLDSPAPVDGLDGYDQLRDAGHAAGARRRSASRARARPPSATRTPRSTAGRAAAAARADPRAAGLRVGQGDHRARDRGAARTRRSRRLTSRRRCAPACPRRSRRWPRATPRRCCT